jgi:Stress responsive A/B Barrel Domain
VSLLHIAWFRFKPGVSSERIEHHLVACRELMGRVPVVRDLQCGSNLSDRAAGMTHGIVVTLADYAALPAYLEHPAHIPVATALKEDIAELRVMDLQI